MQCSYVACMPAVTVRDIPEATRNALAARAANSGQSLQEYLRGALIEMASKPDVAELMTQVRQQKTAAQSSLSADAILGHITDGRR